MVDMLAFGALVLTGPSPDPASPAALSPVRLQPLPAYAVWQCKRVQARSPFRILCPARLPRAKLGWPPGHRAPGLRAQVLPNKRAARQGKAVGISFGYGAPWEPSSGPDWRAHLWRNRPCCFLHLEIFRRRPGPRSVPIGARPAVIGGRRGLLKPATAYDMSSGPGNVDKYWANHVRFLWTERGQPYVASLHYFGRPDTRALLARIVQSLMPATELRYP